jgi:hypothetical protein
MYFSYERGEEENLILFQLRHTRALELAKEGKERKEN